MRIVYIADDGKEFDDEYDCDFYEWKLNHPYLKDINLYDKDNKKLDDIFSETTYSETEKVVVLNENAIKDLHDLSIYTGFCLYEDITECGEWIFNGDIFVKEK